MKITKSKINSLLNFYKMENLPIITATETRLVLFTNKGKKKETHPDYNGFVTQDEGETEKKYRVVAWKTKSKKGELYLSGKIDFSKLAEEKPKKEEEVKDDFLG